jgi:hypothetical protein
MHTTQQPKSFAEVLHDIANRPLVRAGRSRMAPGVQWHADKRKDTRAQAKVNLRKEIGE